MPGDESLQHKLDRVRPPRVQITYDVQVGDAQKKVELPFLLGVLADLSGHPEEPLPSMKERKFVEINRDNFNRIMAGMKPRLAMKVDNQLQKDGTRLGVELKFKSIDDFEPEQVVRQVEPLRKLLEARQRLADLKTKITSNDRLDGLLQDIIKDTDRLKRLGEETGHRDQNESGSSDTGE
ncbi:type VI secretion system contractile sheath small subunit [Tautonia rosea]|uniref:type VI secretion system contractile sheath small subunit n=1 Tax=Tautonia rosea TaxID=2728037 RepID=UPI001472DBA4|nr:type VI secretion system contractile sheath small subunit [Tautonia rosea]